MSCFRTHPTVAPPQIYRRSRHTYYLESHHNPTCSCSNVVAEGKRVPERDSEGCLSNVPEKTRSVKIDGRDFNGESRLWYSSLYNVIRPDLMQCSLSSS
jgi:hypothetical protein